MATEADFYIRQGDTSPAIEAQLQDDTGQPVDLTGSSVSFRMAPPDGDQTVVDSSASIDDASNGRVSYAWSQSDTESAGHYNAEFVVDASTTYPNDDYIVVKVTESLV
jgi:hypothetical protein